MGESSKHPLRCHFVPSLSSPVPSRVTYWSRHHKNWKIQPWETKALPVWSSASNTQDSCILKSRINTNQCVRTGAAFLSSSSCDSKLTFRISHSAFAPWILSQGKDISPQQSTESNWSQEECLFTQTAARFLIAFNSFLWKCMEQCSLKKMGLQTALCTLY